MNSTFSLARLIGQRTLATAKVYSPYPKRAASTTLKPQGSIVAKSLDATSTTTVNPASGTVAKMKYTPSESTSGELAAGLDLKDAPPIPVTASNGAPINWADSFHGIGTAPFPKDVSDVLLAPIANEDIEIKPDGLLYLPEIKYRRILNRAFGPGGWGLVPRTESLVTTKLITREYALICLGRLVSVARGEQDYFGGDEKIPTALEGCKSNALMRCCKDLGIASELWDPSFIRKWKSKYADEIFAEHVVTKKKKKLWKLKSTKTLDYPFKQC
jgi:hypothetical protein